MPRWLPGRPIFVTLLAAAFFISGVTLLLLQQPHWLISSLSRRSPEILWFVRTEEPLVALTIDDGPDRETTPALLRLLKEHDAHATFFVISERVRGNEDLVAQIVTAGHELGNHLTRDERSIGLTVEEFAAEVSKAHEVLSRFGELRWLRPGGGWFDRSMISVAESLGYRVVLGSIYPYDATLPSSSFAAFHTIRKARPGAIVVLHDGGARGQRTLASLERILPELRRQGYAVVSLSQLAESVERP
ncbi:MAG: polysaccharide deacetylase family protein [Gemmatimonadota bacterium]|nr:MAG: polysaccharide deacetylase family protein [Gemmatimonadota bacterium]